MSLIDVKPAAGPAAPEQRCCGQHDAFGILHDCHEHILQRLERLELLSRELAKAERIEDQHLARLCDVLTFLDTAVPLHSADEEQTLFPRMRQAFGDVSGGTPMDCMEQEHVQHQAMLRRLKAAVVKRDAPAVARAAGAIVAEYRNHIGKEETILFPMARELLTSRPLIDAMTQEMRDRRVATGLSGC